MLILLNPMNGGSMKISYYNYIQAGEPFSRDFVEGINFVLNDFLIPKNKDCKVIVVNTPNFFSNGISRGDVLILDTEYEPDEDGLFLVMDGWELAIENKRNIYFNQEIMGRLIKKIKFFNTPFSWMNVPNEFLNSPSRTTPNIDLASLLIKEPEHTFLLQVKGDSMLHADIQEEDVVIVRRDISPAQNDIVVAYVEGGYTLKRLGIKHIPELVPENPKYSTIYMKDFWEDKIAGVAIGIIRDM